MDFFFFTLMLLFSLTPSNAYEDQESKWICTSSFFCVLDPSPNVGEMIRFESQHDCRLSCGVYGAIWPMPTGDISLSDERVHFDPAKVCFVVVAPSEPTTQFIHEANRIFLSNILKECSKNCTAPDNKELLAKVTVNSSSLALDWNTDESYSLHIQTTDTETVVEINAPTIYGARHGLETLSNLITGSVTGGLLMVKAAHINDRPAFPHRGLLLDTARNYMPVQRIKHILDAMATSKFNVFHWHIVDTHSFPMEITRVPQMLRFGAYTKEEVYTRADQTYIIKYARARGIRVLIEIDGPSHANKGWQWGLAAGLGNMVVGIDKRLKYCNNPPCGQLNPFNDNMYAIMKEIYTEVAEIGAPEETIHMGGDEVDIPTWNYTAEITNKMIENGYDLSKSSFFKLWSDFHNRTLASWDEVNKQQKSVIVWSSDLTNATHIEQYLPSDRFVIQTWVNADSPLNEELLAKGYRIILSTEDAWYLDHGFWGSTPYYRWDKIYNNNMPTNELVLGGEVCMWSEFVTGNAVEPRIWPRAGGAAERLWSNPEDTSLFSVEQRFHRYRDRLTARGIECDAVKPRWCVLNEGQCR